MLATESTELQEELSLSLISVVSRCFRRGTSSCPSAFSIGAVRSFSSAAVGISPSLQRNE